jgi:pilus assembly protein TadC
MLLGALILSIGLLLLIIYFALSKNSSRRIKNIAVIALIIVALSLLVSVIIYVIFSQPAAVISTDPVPNPLIVEPPKQIREDSIILALIITGVFILLLFIMVYNALKERKQQEHETKKLRENFSSIKKK